MPSFSHYCIAAAGFLVALLFLLAVIATGTALLGSVFSPLMRASIDVPCGQAGTFCGWSGCTRYVCSKRLQEQGAPTAVLMRA